MRRGLIVLISVVSLVSVGLAQAPKRARRTTEPSVQQKQQFTDDQQAINDLHSKDIQASMALDADKLESLWTDDIVTIAGGGPPVVGIGPNRVKLDKTLEQLRDVEILAYDEQFQEIRVAGDWAYEYGTITGRTRPFKGGDESSSKLNVMRILQRQPDGSWKIARTMYNDANPPADKPAEPAKPAEPEKNKLKD